jgi:regulator of RNase E activity RraA
MTVSSENTDRVREQLEMMTSSDVADLLRQAGVTGIVMRGLRPIDPVGKTVAGRARTLRFLPERSDVSSAPPKQVNRALYDSMERGEVLVIDAMGSTDHAVIGDMMFARLASRGVEVVVVDGAVRDASAAAGKGVAVHARGCSPKSFAGLARAWDADIDIHCAGVLVRPGDWIVADLDGVVVIPAADLDRTLEGAQSQRDDDRFSQALFAAGCTLDDAYPLPPYMRVFQQRFAREGVVPTVEQVRAARRRQD